MQVGILPCVHFPSHQNSPGGASLGLDAKAGVALNFRALRGPGRKEHITAEAQVMCTEQGPTSET